MADQRGRCNNIEFCSVAVSQKIVAVAEGAPFVCAKCQEPLTSVGETRAKNRNVALIGIQVAVLIAGGSVLAWKLTQKPQGEAALVAIVTEPSPPIDPSVIVTASSFVVPQVTSAAPKATPAVAAPEQPPATPVTASVSAPAAPVTVLLRMAGSNVMANRLSGRLASGYLSLIGDTGIAAATDAKDGTTEIVGLQSGQREGIKIASSSSAAGFTALLRGNADVAMSTRKITASEAERLTSLGDLTSPANEHVIAVQGIAVIVSPANRIPSLTVAQTRGILAGKIKDWSEVGGADGAIHVYAVDDQDGSIDTSQDAVAGPDGVTSSVIHAASEPAIASSVAADRNGIGFVTVGNTGSGRVVPIAETGAVAVAPTDLSVATEDYPFTRRLYFYTGGDSKSGFVRRFSDYVGSPTGQAAVEAAGLVALNVKTEATIVPDTASDRFRQIVSGSTRFSVDFRFQPNSTELDSRAVRDMDRLISFVKAQHISPNRIILAGFADNSGAAPVNLAVSQRRADAVSAALVKGGVTPGKVVALGADLPIADNATMDGRERNRRVEVYLAAQ